MENSPRHENTPPSQLMSPIALIHCEAIPSTRHMNIRMMFTNSMSCTERGGREWAGGGWRDR